MVFAKSLFWFFKVTSLELSTGLPLLYIFKDRKFMRRGSPVGPTEAGVYAYTKVQPSKVVLVVCLFPWL